MNDLIDPKDIGREIYAKGSWTYKSQNGVEYTIKLYEDGGTKRFAWFDKYGILHPKLQKLIFKELQKKFIHQEGDPYTLIHNGFNEAWKQPTRREHKPIERKKPREIVTPKIVNNNGLLIEELYNFFEQNNFMEIIESGDYLMDDIYKLFNEGDGTKDERVKMPPKELKALILKVRNRYIKEQT